MSPPRRTVYSASGASWRRNATTMPEFVRRTVHLVGQPHVGTREVARSRERIIIFVVVFADVAVFPDALLHVEDRNARLGDFPVALERRREARAERILVRQQDAVPCIGRKKFNP